MKSDPGLTPPPLPSLCYMTIVDGEERMDTRAALNVAESAIGAVKKDSVAKIFAQSHFYRTFYVQKEHLQIIFLTTWCHGHARLFFCANHWDQKP